MDGGGTWLAEAGYVTALPLAGEVELGHGPVVRRAGCTATPRGAGGLIRMFVFIRLHGVSKTGSAVSRLSLEVTPGEE